MSPDPHRLARPIEHLFGEGQLLMRGVPATGVLVETLLDHGDESDVAEAEAGIERLAARLSRLKYKSTTPDLIGGIGGHRVRRRRGADDDGRVR